MAHFFKSRFLFQRQRAIGLLELMLSIAIISVLLLMSIRYYSSLKYQERLTQASTMVRDIISAASSWGAANPNFENISIEQLINVNLLPPNYGKNPWAGTVQVSPKKGDIYSIAINFTEVPEDPCKSLKAQFPDYSINCGEEN
ncbi:MAG: hypothetical protein LEGION0398_MBIBDBAK_01153 [Legionellaceae bacterium]